MHVIATAGHVDHGKSTLIRALTGMEPDRWAEEKRRGMTIDLGYAWTSMPNGEVVAFVDVPGHQRFVTNMLAGVGPVPAVLFVVAADEGWSAQSREHLDCLNALQVRHGILVLTRSDLGDAELAEAEARDYLAGTTLENMPAVAVNAPAGAGLDELRSAIMAMVADLPTSVGGVTRLWVDRVFTIRGAGTVVTGTLSSGTIAVGDELQVHPSGELVRVRSIESLKMKVDQVSGVARVALNLRGVKATDLRRGDALIPPNSFLSVELFDARLSSPKQLPRELTVHVGSAAVPATVRPLETDLVRLRLHRPLPLRIGERVVLRDPGAQRVLCAAVVLDPMPPPLTRRGAARRRTAELADVDGHPDLAGEIRRRHAVRRNDLLRAGVAVTTGIPDDAVAVGEWLIEADHWDSWRQRLSSVVAQWAGEHPLLPGMPRQAVAAGLDLPDSTLVDKLVAAVNLLTIDSSGVHTEGQQADLPPAVLDALERLSARLAENPFDTPEVPELTTAGLTERYLAVATREGRLLRVASGIYLKPEALDQAVERLSRLAQPFTMAQARMALQTTRRVAVPLLELLDRRHRTYRVDSQSRKVRG